MKVIKKLGLLLVKDQQEMSKMNAGSSHRELRKIKNLDNQGWKVRSENQSGITSRGCFELKILEWKRILRA